MNSPSATSTSPNCSLLEEHQQHLHAVLAGYQDHSLIINPAKTVLGVENMKLLGHHVHSTGIKPLETKVQVIRDFPKPTTQRKLREFLGLAKFYYDFVPNCAAILVPFNSMLSSAQHSQAPLNWSSAAESAFTKIKDALDDPSLLVLPIPDIPTCIVTDASDTAVGAVIQQCIGEDWSSIAFFYYPVLQPSETRYHALDRELLAAYFAISTSGILLKAAASTSSLTPHLHCFEEWHLFIENGGRNFPSC